MKAVIYARYSAHNQNQKSIEEQIKICRKFANDNKFKIVSEYIDYAFANKNNRLEFRKMIDDSQSQKFEAIIISSMDRFSRNRYDLAIYKNELRRNGIKVIPVKKYDDATGVLMDSILESMAEYYSFELSRKIKAGKARKKQKEKN